MLPSLVSLHFFCNIWIVGSEFNINKVKLWLHPGSGWQWRCKEMFSWTLKYKYHNPPSAVHYVKIIKNTNKKKEKNGKICALGFSMLFKIRTQMNWPKLPPPSSFKKYLKQKHKMNTAQHTLTDNMVCFYEYDLKSSLIFKCNRINQLTPTGALKTHLWLHLLTFSTPQKSNTNVSKD